jgi:hypothetical protein
MAAMPSLSMVAQIYGAGRNLGVRQSDGVGFVRTLSPCTYLRTGGLCLSLAGLVNQTLAPFLCGAAQNARKQRRAQMTNRRSCDEIIVAAILGFA